MAPERLADPEITQALEEIEDTLRAERRALAPLPDENVELRARLERLMSERDQLQGELEELLKGRARNHPRLPEVLNPPFVVRSPVPVRRMLRTALPSLALLVVLLSFMKDSMHLGQTIFLLVLGVFLVLRLPALWVGGSSWQFSEADIRGYGKKTGVARVLYSSITSVKVDATPSQRRRGVGTIQVTYQEEFSGEMEKLLTLEDVPEPERLASWIQAKRSPRLGTSG